MKVSINFTDEYFLENEKVLLRPLHYFDNLSRFSEEQPELWRYSLITATGLKNLQNYLQIAENGRNEQKEYPVIVFEKKTNEYAGSTRFYDIQPDFQTLQLDIHGMEKSFRVRD